MAASDLPVLVKHCALAIYKSGDVRGSGIEKTLGALDIARHRLTEYGFLKSGSEAGEPSKIRLTAKGLKAEARHLREVGSRPKTRAWDKLYRLTMVAEEEEAADGAMTDGPEAYIPPGPQGAAARKKQEQVRRARTAKRRTRRARVPRAKRPRRG
jgi:hypothetical protein